jgi:octaprenyl-diphosphate synthase
MTMVRPTLNEIYAPVDKDLRDFSVLLKKELGSTDPLISDIHTHLLKMAGKFLRPALAIIASKVAGKDRPEIVRLAVAIELIHTATLVHDDIIDDSDLRRNQPTIYSKWGREISIVSGDYLYAKAFLLLADLKDIWVSQAFAACAHVMCEGEMKQIERRTHFLISEKEYLKIIHQKTAALFQAACIGGGYYSGTSQENIEKLGNYGFGLGMAFQIVDDCLDLVGDTESLGKTAGLDIYKNDVTLPLLYLFQELNETERRELLAANPNNGDGAASFDKIKRLAQEKKSVEKAMDKARDYIEKALEDLSGLNDSPYKDSLAQLANYCIDRVR